MNARETYLKAENLGLAPATGPAAGGAGQKG
jgi:hypothetical protein